MSKLLITISGRDGGVVYDIDAFEINHNMSEGVDTLITLHGVTGSVELESLNDLVKAVTEKTTEIGHPSGTGIAQDKLAVTQTDLADNKYIETTLISLRLAKKVEIVSDFTPEIYTSRISNVTIKTNLRPFSTENGYKITLDDVLEELVALEKFNSNNLPIVFVNLPKLCLTTDQQEYYITEIFNVVEKIVKDDSLEKDNSMGDIII